MFGKASNQTKEELPGKERRAEYRQRVLKAGELVFNRGYTCYACRVRNLSNNGAMIEMETTVGLPSEFEFRIKSSDKACNVKTAWKEPTRIGIQYLN